MLDRLDKWFEGHGYYFVRYADDFQIYAKSEAKAKKIMDKTTAFIEKRLKLVVNQEKSAIGKIDGRSFLGFKLASKPEKADIRITKAAVKSFKDKVRKKTKRNRGKSIFWVISDLNRLIRGWCQYFGIADVTSVWKRLDAWIRRRLRCYRIKQRKRKYSIMTFVKGRGVSKQAAWNYALSDDGWWRRAYHPTVHKALSNRWFKRAGLLSLVEIRSRVKTRFETAVCDIARTVV